MTRKERAQKFAEEKGFKYIQLQKQWIESPLNKYDVYFCGLIEDVSSSKRQLHLLVDDTEIIHCQSVELYEQICLACMAPANL